MKKESLLTIFSAILILAIFLRVFNITIIPPGVNRDEASIGFTAYSLLETGKDEYGQMFPLAFQSFGDWKPPLYIYATAFFVSFLGISELSVRLLSILAGVGTVFVTFFLVYELFKKTHLALLSSLLLAISPWHIHLSRVESESNTAVFFVTLASLLFLKSVKGRYLLFPISALFFALTYYTYAGNFIFTTLLVLGLILIYRDELLNLLKRKEIVIGVLIFSLMSSIIWYQSVFANTTKLSGISIFGDPSVIHAEIELPRNRFEDPNALIPKLLYNRATFAISKFTRNYINAFSPEFLFIKGGGNRAHNIEGFGNMYIVEAPFLFIGVLTLLLFKKTRETKLVLWWFLIAPIAASMTKDAPHTNRMFAIFPILPLMVAVGIQWFLSVFNKYQFHRRLAIGVLTLLFLANSALYLDRYFVRFPINEAAYWGVGFKNLSERLTQADFQNKPVVMTRPEYSPYIFLLFYQQFDPATYQQTATRYPKTDDGFVHVAGFGRYEFRKIDWEKDLQLENTLLVDWSEDIPRSVLQIYNREDIVLPDGESMFTIIKTK